MLSLVEIGLYGFWRGRFKNFIKFVIISPPKRSWPFILTYIPFKQGCSEKVVTLHFNLYPLQTRMLSAKFGSNLPNDSGDEDKLIKSFWESLQFFFQTLKIFSSAGIMTMSISQREDCGFFSSNSLKTWNISLATRTGGMFRLPQPSAGKEILFMPPCTACFRHSSTNVLNF